ncbi:Uncharacterised protein [uncultured archaeon]|nr:Uncharacterised protein [uncultured archaeon]
MFAWYPLIKDIVPTPKTMMIEQSKDFDSFEAALGEGNSLDPEMQRLVNEADKAAQQLGGYPVFMRSDYTSHKHDWVDSCYVTSKESLQCGIANILEFTLMTEILGFRGVVIREFLDLPHEFHAFNGMPVSQEFRYFVKNGEVLCRHPYWMPAAMQRVDCELEEAIPKLKKIQVLPELTKQLLDSYAVAISKAVTCLNAPDNCWSVDFCFARGRGWMVTDMAVGEDSEHYATCPNADPKFLKMRGDPDDISKATSLPLLHRQAEEMKKRLESGDKTPFDDFLNSLG